jgi:glycosyltransferase involved in cell wall biosynthesis
MEPIRILEVIPSLGCGGAERMVVNLITHLDRRRFQVAAINLGHSEGWVLEERLAREQVQVWHLDKEPGFDPRIFHRVRAVVRQFRPHLVHSHLCLHYVYLSLIGCRPLRRVVTVHLPAETIHKQATRWLARMAYRRGVVPVAVSQGVANWLECTHGVEDCMVIPNGIPIDDYQCPSKPRQVWRREQGFQEEDVLFVCAARLEKQKNHAMLLEAFARGPATSRRARLLLAGDGERRPALEEQARELGIQEKVRFLGLRADICEVLAAADVFVLASHSEGNPLSLMEAMAAGLPVVATAVGGVPELISDRISGLLVAPGDGDGLVAAMLRLLQDGETRRTMAAAAAQYAKKAFSASRMAQGYMELYERLLEETRAVQDPGAEMVTRRAN